MRHIAMVAVLSCLAIATSNAQEKAAWGSLSGKIVDGKTKEPVADAIVFLKPVNGGFPIHADDRVRKDLTIQVPAGRTFDSRMVAHYPHYLDGDKKKVSTGQKLVFVGDKVQDHIFQFSAFRMLATDESAELAFRRVLLAGARDPLKVQSQSYIAAGERVSIDLQFLAGHSAQSQAYAELRLHVFAFNHPYFSVTKKDGTFTMPRVPAGKEVIVWAWQEDIGYVLTKTGKKMTFKEGKNTVDLESETPK
jgi:hypothetical protein